MADSRIKLGQQVTVRHGTGTISHAELCSVARDELFFSHDQEEIDSYDGLVRYAVTIDNVNYYYTKRQLEETT